MIQLTRSGTVVSASTDDVARLRADFDRQHCVKLPKFFEPGLLQLIQRQIEGATFYRRVHARRGSASGPVELCMEGNTTSGLLLFLVSGDELFRVIEQITGCDPIGHFNGRVYRMHPDSDHYDQWHTDAGRGRMIAMSVNLGTEVYEGGVLQIRERSSKRMVHEVWNDGIGDAIIFRVAPHLEHRVSNIEGSVPRTAYAGWFVRQPGGRTTAEYRIFGLGRPAPEDS
jgi:hypothetical protein